MSSLFIKRLLAFIFIGLGSWCLFFPGTVESLGLKPEYVTGSIVHMLLIACFGAQAVLCGMVIAFSEFTPRTFLVFGLAGSIPFFVFNYYFYFVAEVFTHWMLLDFLGNIVILGCGIAGYRLSKREQSRIEIA